MKLKRHPRLRRLLVDLTGNRRAQRFLRNNLLVLQELMGIGASGHINFVAVRDMG